MTSTPTPQRLYVHDDLTDAVATRGPEALLLTRALFTTMAAEPHVVVLSLTEQLDAVVRAGGHPPFTLAIGIGPAGERVARALHARAGWFPVIQRVDIARAEDGAGGYVLTGSAPLSEQLAGVRGTGSVAIVDDTIFSGLTMQAVLAALPEGVLGRTRAFCLRGVAESVPAIEELCPITVGFAAPGRITDEVSFINASGLVRRGAIRRVGAAPLAFFERPEWIAAWFPHGVEEVLRLCRQLNALVDEAPGASVGEACAV